MSVALLKMCGGAIASQRCCPRGREAIPFCLERNPSRRTQSRFRRVLSVAEEYQPGNVSDRPACEVKARTLRLPATGLGVGRATIGNCRLPGPLRSIVSSTEPAFGEKGTSRLSRGRMRNNDWRGFGLGLPPGRIVLQDHSEHWGRAYYAESLELKRALDGCLIDLQHVGSTCIEGIKAKPVIDILAGIASLPLDAKATLALTALQYESLGRTVVPGHHVFATGARREFLLHVVEHGGPAWNRMVQFRDVLKSNRAIAREYEALKVRLGHEFVNDRAGYADAKTIFIDNAIRTGSR